MSELRTSTPIEVEAAQNFEKFQQMPYPGRFIVSGLSDQNQIIQVYAIMGRSPTSRSRYFQMDEKGVVSTEPLDPTQPTDPLTLYPAMREQDGIHIVTNGRQTNNIVWAAASMMPFDLKDALEERTFEPDPSHTPRISAINNQGIIQFSILREDPQNPGKLEEPRSFPPMTDLVPGIGYEIQTYTGDGTTDSYRGEPIPMTLEGNAEEIADTYWNALNVDNKVSLVVKAMNPTNGEYQIIIRNKYTPASEAEQSMITS
jgi:IMP cyclohydrolase